MTTQATTIGAAAPTSRWWNVSLWTVQILLAAAFGMSGSMKLVTPVADLAAKMAWVSAVPSWLVRFIGVSEVAGALGLLLPSLARILPRLTPLAALGLTTIMVLAIPFHLSRGEANFIGAPVILGGLTAFVAWGRFRKSPIPPRS